MYRKLTFQIQRAQVKHSWNLEYKNNIHRHFYTGSRKHQQEIITDPSGCWSASDSTKPAVSIKQLSSISE